MIIEIEVPFRVKIEAKNIDPLLEALRKVKEYTEPEPEQSPQKEETAADQSVEEQMTDAHAALENQSILDKLIEQLSFKSSYLKDRKFLIQDAKNLDDERLRLIRSQLNNQPPQDDNNDNNQTTITTSQKSTVRYVHHS